MVDQLTAAPIRPLKRRRRRKRTRRQFDGNVLLVALMAIVFVCGVYLIAYSIAEVDWRSPAMKDADLWHSFR